MYVTLHATQKKPKLDLGSVMSLLEYLHSLPQTKGDRDLSWSEDRKACQILRELEEQWEAPSLSHMINYYTDPQYKISRTMCVWYGIAKNIAEIIQCEDQCPH
jgi:hypothetical protein